MSVSDKTPIKLAIAIIISAFLTFLIAFVFIRLSEVGSGDIDPEDIKEIVIALDGTVWKTDSKGRKTLSSIFLLDFPSNLHVDRYGDEALLFTFDGFSVIVSVDGDKLSGIINGFPFNVSVSRSYTGEGEAISIIHEDEVVVYYR